jgi:beta-phosphoglucomutase-like phosphatase (HAD superfamily)
MAVRAAGLRTAIVSSSFSANTEAVLTAGGVDSLFDVRVDPHLAQERGLRAKPAPDTFLDAARQLGVAAPNAAVFDTALAGAAAGRAGNFGFVVGVDRVGGPRHCLRTGPTWRCRTWASCWRNPHELSGFPSRNVIAATNRVQRR